MLKGGSVLKSIVKALGLVVGLTLSGIACAVGMGGINVITALGEPLRAEIELVAIGKAERNSLSARMASRDTFKSAGMDYPGGLPALKFQVETRANGELYLNVTSKQPVNDPFVNMLVELSWSSGRLLREYTFLLDPPGYKAEQSKVAEVNPVAPDVASMPMRATVPMDEEVSAEADALTGRKPDAGGNVASGAIKVKRGDTLSGIARQVKPSEISLERMLVALYRTNADAFDGKNMNRLKTGKILRMPANEDLDKLTQREAAKEIHVQVADWHAYRQKLAAASGAAAEYAPKQEASGKISTTVADKTLAAKESAKEVVRLSKGETPGDKTVTAGNAKALQDKVNTMEEEAIAKSKALKESSERIALLEKNIKEMQHLIELKGQPVATAKPALGKTEEPTETKPASKTESAKVDAKPPTPAPAVAPVVASQASTIPAAGAAASASAVKPAKPAAKPVAKPKLAPPPPSMLDDPLYLAGGAALLALGGLGFMLARRGKSGKAKKKIPGSSEAAMQDITAASSHISAPVAPSPETGDFTQSAAVAPISPIQSEDVDPINEADLFLSFGRDAQAEEILKDALEKNPASNNIRLKLLSIYANRKDIKAFSVIARQVKDSDDVEAWAQAAGMGRNLEPNNPMYGGTGGEAGIAAAADQGKNKQQQAVGLDFDLGFGAPEAAAAAKSGGAAPNEKAASKSVDFDLDLNEPNQPEANAVEDFTSTLVLNAPPGKIMDKPHAGAAPESEMDFDITSTHQTSAAPEQEQAAAIAPEMNDLVFDITATHPSVAAIKEEKTADVSADADQGLAFTLDFPVADKPEATPAQTAAKELDLSGVSLDMGKSTPVSAPAGAVKDAHWHDVATKLDLAKAYQEMGDNAGAREILEEVLAEGDDQQRATAEGVLKQLMV